MKRKDSSWIGLESLRRAFLRSPESLLRLRVKRSNDRVMIAETEVRRVATPIPVVGWASGGSNPPPVFGSKKRAELRVKMATQHEQAKAKAKMQATLHEPLVANDRPLRLGLKRAGRRLP